MIWSISLDFLRGIFFSTNASNKENVSTAWGHRVKTRLSCIGVDITRKNYAKPHHKHSPEKYYKNGWGSHTQFDSNDNH